MIEPIEALYGGADAKVANGQNVGPIQVDQQKHICGPAPKTLGGSDLLANLVVRKLVQPIDLQLAGEDLLSQRTNVFDLHSREPDLPQVGGIEGQQLLRCRQPAAKPFLEPAGDGAGRESRNLLANDGIDEHAERVAYWSRPPPFRRIDGLNRVDEPGELSVAGSQGGQRAA